MLFDKVSNDTVISIFRDAVTPSYKTRAQIAEHTGFSIATVGSVIDGLSKSGLIVQTLRPATHSGRRSKYISPKKSCVSAVFSLYENGFNFSLVDISGNIVSSCYGKSDGILYYDNELKKFISLYYDFIKDHVKIKNKFMGVGVLVNTKYDPQVRLTRISPDNTLLRLPLKELFYDSDITDNLIITDCGSAILEDISKRENKSKRIFTLFIDDNISCASFNGGDKDFYVLPCGNYCGINGKELNKLVNLTPDIDRQVEVLSKVLIFTIYTQMPDKIYMIGSRYTKMATFCELIKMKTELECLKSNLKVPEFVISENLFNPAAAMGRKIRDKWFCELLNN